MDDHNADEVPRTDDYDERSERWSIEAFDNSSVSTNLRLITAAQTKPTAGSHLLPMLLSARALMCVPGVSTYPGRPYWNHQTVSRNVCPGSKKAKRY
jgi:hypothetical protein